jgi:hypothetical protein
VVSPHPGPVSDEQHSCGRLVAVCERADCPAHSSGAVSSASLGRRLLQSAALSACGAAICQTKLRRPSSSSSHHGKTSLKQMIPALAEHRVSSPFTLYSEAQLALHSGE